MAFYHAPQAVKHTEFSKAGWQSRPNMVGGCEPAEEEAV